MIEHVVERAQMFANWDQLILATCDLEIAEFGRNRNYTVRETSKHHTRALDRVAEAVATGNEPVSDDDIIVCVQGDEPMMRPDMIETVLAPFESDAAVEGTILAMEIVDDELFRSPDTVKIVHDLAGDVLYTSRAPIPYCERLKPESNAHRIYGIFGFRWSFLRWFNDQPESPLEQLESCDSNRICDNGRRQRVAIYPYVPSFLVDRPADLKRVEKTMKNDPYWGSY